MVGLKGLAAQLFAKHSLAKEFDPESELPADGDDGNQNEEANSDSEAEVPEDTQNTEHYLPVGKSKLRRNETVALGPAYRGKRVSRKQLEEGSDGEEKEDSEEEFDDPDEVDIEGAEDVHTDDEIDSDEAFGEDDEELLEKFTFRGSSKPKTPKGEPISSDEEPGEDEEGDDSENDSEGDSEDDEIEKSDSDPNGSDSEGLDEDSDHGETEDVGSAESEMDDDADDFSDDSADVDDSEVSNDSGDFSDDNDYSDKADTSAAKTEAETQKILAQERKQVLASISQSAKADADKGFAVRRQRQTFDAILNMRIRMQKALSTANTLHTVAEGDIAKDATIEEAAAKVVELLNAVQGIRKSFYVTGSNADSTKRKRAAVTETSSSCQAIFDEMAVTEQAALAKRRKVLDRWSARVQRPSTSSAAGASRLFNGATASTTLTAVLDGQLATAERLVRRTRTPRSCAPVQAAKSIEEDPEIYDDADFYQLLLKELVDQRTVDGTAPGSEAPTVRWAASAAQDAKTRKSVDRKASKGRKMRYNVHAKLQNFTAPEDRRDWEPEAIDRFFSSLFGQRMVLQEDDASDEDGDDDGEVMGGVSIGGETSLRLF
ncbi:rRNA-processing protein bfr2 [Sporothrix epigloea]|uniref:Protein BFR2 n=1 Tax=Sporothrix epigloea TaxID=1892477 RepID=A0ABP0DC06_9PEZI